MKQYPTNAGGKKGGLRCATSVGGGSGAGRSPRSDRGSDPEAWLNAVPGLGTGTEEGSGPWSGTGRRAWTGHRRRGRLRPWQRRGKLRTVDRRWKFRTVHTLWWTSAGSRHRTYRAGEAHWRPGAWSRHRWHRTDYTGFRANAMQNAPNQHLSPISIDSPTVSGSLLGSADRLLCLPPKNLGLPLGCLWLWTPASSLSSFTPRELPPKKGLAST